MYSYCLYQENIEQSNTEQSVIGASLFNIVFVLCTMVVSMTGVTRLPCKPDVSPDGRPIRLRQHGLFSFPQNIHNVIFLWKRSGFFRPAGGWNAFRFSDRV